MNDIYVTFFIIFLLENENSRKKGQQLLWLLEEYYNYKKSYVTNYKFVSNLPGFSKYLTYLVQPRLFYKKPV